MIVKKITVENFRNIEKAEIQFSEDLSILCGENAQGKTNVLEGIYLFAQGRSFRTSREKELIGQTKEYAYLKLDYEAQTDSQQAEMRFLKNGKKSVKRNGIPERKMSAFLGGFRAVLFCPEHLNIVKAGPAERRRFLNEALAQLSSGYIGALQRYNGILAQRNKLLQSYYEQRNTVEQTIHFWNEQLAEEAAYISVQRENYVQKMCAEAKQFFFEMTEGKEKPDFRYTGAREKKDFIKQLEESFSTDVRVGTTTKGIHKDDIAVTINGKEARGYGSQGQQRSLALAMKLAEAEISRGKTNEYPVMLLDDILSELDETRKQFVLSGVKGKQVMITTCEANGTALMQKIKPKNGAKPKIITVENGKYESCMYI